MSNRVLLAFDGTACAEKAFEAVLKWPVERRAALLLLAVIRPSIFAVDYGAQTVLEGARGELSARLDQLQRRAQFVGTNCTYLVRLGHPVDKILETARERQADLIVTGCRGGLRWLPKRWNSVSTRVRALAPCEVWVVR